MSKPVDRRTREQILRMAAQTDARQKEIARALQVSPMTVSRILKNSR